VWTPRRRGAVMRGELQLGSSATSQRIHPSISLVPQPGRHRGRFSLSRCDGSTEPKNSRRRDPYRVPGATAGRAAGRVIAGQQPRRSRAPAAAVTGRFSPHHPCGGARRRSTCSTASHSAVVTQTHAGLRLGRSRDEDLQFSGEAAASLLGCVGSSRRRTSVLGPAPVHEDAGSRPLRLPTAARCAASE
jgi:hypothetical protein